MSNSTSNTESTSKSSSNGGTHKLISLESLVPYKGLILSTIEKLSDGVNLLSLIINNAEVSKADLGSLRALNNILQAKDGINYHVATIRDIYDLIGKEWRPSIRYFNFSPDGETVEEVNEENYNGDKNSEVEEIPDYL